MHWRSPYTPRLDKKRLEEMFSKGLTVTTMARRLGATKYAVHKAIERAGWTRKRPARHSSRRELSEEPESVAAGSST